jgi:alkylhydroperoxidase family enzyme
MSRITAPAGFDGSDQAYAGSLAPEISQAIHGLSQAIYRHSKLPLRIFEAARMRVALINGCLLCQNFRSVVDVEALLAASGGAANSIATRGEAPEEDFYLNIADWRTSPLYSDREKLAIEYAERYSLAPDPLGYDDEFWARMKAAFTDAEIYDLTICISSWIAGGRYAHVLGFDQACGIEPPVAHAAE